MSPLTAEVGGWPGGSVAVTLWEMAATVTVNDVLNGHVVLDLECLDRIYLNGYVPNLQVGGQVVSFLTQHLGNPIPSPAILERIGTAFRRAVGSFAADNEIPVVHFGKDDRKIDVMRPYLAGGRPRIPRRDTAPHYICLGLPSRPFAGLREIMALAARLVSHFCRDFRVAPGPTAFRNRLGPHLAGHCSAGVRASRCSRADSPRASRRACDPAPSGGVSDMVDAAEHYLDEHGLARPHLAGNSWADGWPSSWHGVGAPRASALYPRRASGGTAIS